MNELTKGYKDLLQSLKEQIKTSQIRAIVSVNSELIRLYWEIGSSIKKKQEQEGWGAKTIEKLAKDLKSAFPEMKGFSRTNISYMVQFANAYPDFQFVQQAVGQIPWSHNIILLQNVSNQEERLWYARKTIESGWSRAVLQHWIDSELYKRQGKAVTNFKDTLPSPQSDLAHETLRDPYNFDFLTLAADHRERDLEQGLVDNIQQTLLELGQGFAFVGKQVDIEVSGSSFRIDLLFYHTKLHCYVVVELKSTAFKPEYTGQLNFYLAAVDDLLRHPDDKPTIGMLLCKTKDNLIVEYALRNVQSPIGVAAYEATLVEKLPKEFRGSLPTIEELETELQKNS